MINVEIILYYYILAIEYLVYTIENILLTSYKYFLSVRITFNFWDIYIYIYIHAINFTIFS